MPLETRLLASIDRTTSGCWLWKRGQNGAGYGKTTVERRDWLTHRLVFELVRGPIPEGMVLDHLCRVTICCNPWHLEPVTKRENAMRGLPSFDLTGRCLSGQHAIVSNDDYVTLKSGKRRCRQCRLEESRRTNERRRREGYKQQRPSNLGAA